MNSTLDEPAADAASPNCAGFPSGKCILRAAIMRTNYATGLDTITVPSGVYVLTRVGFDDDALVGDLDIKDDLTIQGAGSGLTIVDGNGAVTHDRVFQILSSAQNVSLSGLTIRNGTAPTATTTSLIGGGIYRDGNTNTFTPPSLRLSDVVIDANSAENGGGICGAGVQLELNNTTLRANTATNLGGGLSADGSVLTIRDSTVYSNAAYAGGGLSLSDIYDGHIERSGFYSNTAGSYGGGSMVYQTYVPSAMLIDQTTQSHNMAQYGGAIYY